MRGSLVFLFSFLSASTLCCLCCLCVLCEEGASSWRHWGSFNIGWTGHGRVGARMSALATAAGPLATVRGSNYEWALFFATARTGAPRSDAALHVTLVLDVTAACSTT